MAVQFQNCTEDPLSKIGSKVFGVPYFLIILHHVKSGIRLVAFLGQCFYVFCDMVSQCVAQASLKLLSSGEFVSPALKWAEAESR